MITEESIHFLNFDSSASNLISQSSTPRKPSQSFRTKVGLAVGKHFPILKLLFLPPRIHCDCSYCNTHPPAFSTLFPSLPISSRPPVFPFAGFEEKLRKKNIAKYPSLCRHELAQLGE